MPPLVLGIATLFALQRPDSSPADTIPLAPVTVTATRAERSVFEVPLALTRVGKPQLFGTTGYGLNDALSLVPGVVAQSRYGSSDIRLTIRGFGARGAGDRSNAGTARGIRVLLDGFPETEPDGRTSFDGIDLATAQSVEVIRSNASATWGNAAGGVINVSTLPDFDAPFGALEPLAGSYGLLRYAARGGLPVGAGRLSAAFVRTDFDGWRIHSGSARSLLNLALVTPLDERTRLGLFGMGSLNLFRIPGPLTAAEVAADPRQANATYLARDERRDNRLGRIGASLDHQMGDGAARTISATVFVSPKSLHRSERGTYRDFTRYHVGGSVVAHVGRFTAGADQALQDGAILFYSLTPTGTRGDTLRADKREGARSAGVFAQQELPIGRALTVTLGARYDDITYDYEDFLDPALDARRSFRGLTPKFGLNYRLSPGRSVYANVGGGVEAPAGNETDPASTFGQDTVTAINPLLEPIRSTTYEIGTRHTVSRPAAALVRDLAYDVALYQTEVRDEIVPYRGGRFYFTAGRVRRRGAELGVTLLGAGGLSLRTALAYAAHRYVHYVVDSVHYGSPGAVADYSGNRVVGVPRLTYSVSAGLSSAAGTPLELRVTLQGISSYFADDANQVRVPASTVAGVTLGIADPVAVAGPVGLRGFITINTVLNRAYIASAFLNPDVVGGEPVAFEPGLPRTLVVSLSLSTIERR